MAKLNFNFIPLSTMGVNVRSLRTPEEWDIIRKQCYATAGHRCEICGAVNTKFECHEQWGWYKKTKMQTLLKLLCLCNYCHRGVHLNLQDTFRSAVIDHVCYVNNWSKLQFQFAYNEEARQNLMRSLRMWTVDTSAVDSYLKPFSVRIKHG